MADIIITFFKHFLRLLMPVEDTLVLWPRFNDPDFQLCLKSKKDIKLEIDSFLKLCNVKLRNTKEIHKITLNYYIKDIETVMVYDVIFSQKYMKWHIINTIKIKKTFDHNFVSLTFKLDMMITKYEIEQFLLEKFIPRFLSKINILEIVPKINRHLEIFKIQTKKKCNCKLSQCKVIYKSVNELVCRSLNMIYQEKCLTLFKCENTLEFSEKLKTAIANSNIHDDD